MKLYLNNSIGGNSPFWPANFSQFLYNSIASNIKVGNLPFWTNNFGHILPNFGHFCLKRQKFSIHTKNGQTLVKYMNPYAKPRKFWPLYTKMVKFWPPPVQKSHNFYPLPPLQYFWSFLYRVFKVLASLHMRGQNIWPNFAILTK